MKSLVVGFGSAGQRHSKLLNDLGHEVVVVSEQENVPYPRYISVEEAIRRHTPQYIVIASPTSRHAANFSSVHSTEFVGSMLIEKPLFNQYLENPVLERPNTFVGYNLRFLDALQRVREAIVGEKILTASLYDSQYLPDWRPQRDYRETTSARADLGGGVLRDLSHEIDLTHYLFGTPKSVNARLGSSGTLEIDTEDIVDATLEMSDGSVVTLHLSYLDRQPRRTIEVQTLNHSIYSNLLTGEVTINGVSNFHQTDRIATFRDMHEDVLTGRPSRSCTFAEGVLVMRTMARMQESSLARSWVVW